MSGRTVYSVGEALGLRALVDRDLACKVCGYTMQRHVHGHSCAMFVTDAATTPELTALRSQVSELRADLEVACGALERLSNLPIDENDGPDILHLNGEALQGPAVDWTFKMVRKVKEIARTTLNSIRKDG